MDIFNLLPYADIFDDAVILKDGSVAHIYEVNLDEYEEQSIQQRNDISDMFRRFFENLPNNIYFQIFYNFTSEANNVSTSNSSGFFAALSKRRCSFFNAKKHQSCSIYFSLVYDNNSISSKSILKSTISYLFGSYKGREVFNKSNEKLLEYVEYLEKFFGSQNISFNKLKSNELKSLLHSSINNIALADSKKRNFGLSGYATSFELTEKEYNLEKLGRFQLDDEYCNITTMNILPEITEPHNRHQENYAVPLLHPLFFNLNFDHRVVVSSRPINSRKELLKKSVELNVNKIFRGVKKDLGAKEQELEILNQEVSVENKKLGELFVSVIIFDEDKKRLKQKSREVLDAFGLIAEAKGFLENVETLQCFLSSLPGAASYTHKANLVKSENIADFVNFLNYPNGDGEGILFHNRNDKPILIDFDNEGGDGEHLLTVGPTGSGKSVACCNILTKLAELGYKIFIADRYKSYHKLITLLGGSCYILDINNPTSFNPFDLRGNKLGETKILTLTKFIQALLKNPGEKVTELPKPLRPIIEKSIKDLYAEFGKKTPILEDFVKVFEVQESDDIDLKSYKANLKSYLQIELFCKFFNVRETNFSLERNNYIYFDLAGLDSDPELQSLVAMCLADLMNDFTEVFAEERKIFVFDEAWHILKNKELGLADLVFTLYRTVRKKKGFVWSLSQSALEFDDEDTRAAIKSNTAKILIMKQNQNTWEDTQRVFGLTDEQMMQIMSLKKSNEFSEMYLYNATTNKSVILRVKLCPHEYWLYTTSPDDNIKLNKFIRKYDNNVMEAIDALVG